MNGVGLDSNCLALLFVRLPGVRVGSIFSRLEERHGSCRWRVTARRCPVVPRSALYDVVAMRL
jgi:hypothetical protein